MPIFYEVEIRDIRYQLGNYGMALEKHRVKHNHKVEKWRDALVEAGNIFGDHVEGTDNNGLGANGLVKTILMGGNVVFEERNCSKEPKYLTELQELVGNDNVRFPMVIVNGKDLCGEEEVEDVMVMRSEKKVPDMYISEEISAEFRGSLLAIVGLIGIIYLRTHSPKYFDNKETEFSFRVNGTSGVKRFVMQYVRN
ncbi:hypothetical protein AgCh_009991 [Apium graveolens]